MDIGNLGSWFVIPVAPIVSSKISVGDRCTIANPGRGFWKINCQLTPSYQILFLRRSLLQHHLQHHQLCQRCQLPGARKGGRRTQIQKEKNDEELAAQQRLEEEKANLEAEEKDLVGWC